MTKLETGPTADGVVVVTHNAGQTREAALAAARVRYPKKYLGLTLPAPSEFGDALDDYV